MAAAREIMGPRNSRRVAGVEYVNRREGAAILDQQARKYLDMSGEEFIRKYKAGEIADPESTNVRRVATLIPLAEP